MSYNPEKNAPRTLEEYNICVDYWTNKSQAEHDAGVAEAQSQAESAFEATREGKREAMIAELEADLALEVVETPEGPQDLSETEYKAAWNKGVAAIDKQLNEELVQAIQQAASMVEPAKTRGYFEQMYSCYYPQPVPAPEPEPTTEELFAQLRSFREVKLREYDAKISQLDRQIRENPDYAAYQLERAAWDEYATALCNLPSMAGAPWDGGGPLTPWPVKPE